MVYARARRVSNLVRVARARSFGTVMQRGLSNWRNCTALTRDREDSAAVVDIVRSRRCMGEGGIRLDSVSAPPRASRIDPPRFLLVFAHQLFLSLAPTNRCPL